ncbi:Hypothetical predicted protein [Mytilus galloprovincialis]|uniref:CARD domain-containing protein n=1 Tax=Mytilus galloprovincialis TaxID=29158 RepID=A0A8B6GRP2_MYTGA|nr:Hypothetical predicted protein [Mytilus galloprovincialis]
MVPTEIKLMADKRSIDLYLKLLESGSEKKRDIRLVVVGKKGAGKTSLIRRLFGEDITDVTSTNGIEIHKIKCKAESDDGIWNKLDERNEETEMHARLLKPYEKKLQDKGAIDEGLQVCKPLQDNKTATNIEKVKELQTVPKQAEMMKPPENTQVKPSKLTEYIVKSPVTTQQPNESLEKVQKDIETMLKSKVDFKDEEEYGTLLLWDFAGDEEFYHTHQTFLSPDAIYLVVTKLSDADNKDSQDLFRLWMNSIHCYSKLEGDKYKYDDKNTTQYYIDPPVVVVGTWKDDLTSCMSGAQQLEDACREKIFKYTEDMSEDERRHIRKHYFISNTDDDNSVFQLIRRYIGNLSKSMRTWNIDYPLKFIQLEQKLQERKKLFPIITYQDIKDMSSSVTPKPLSDNDLELFLHLHHEVRTLVYFKNLPDYIVLDTQWLSDAFKCIVTAKKFRAKNIINQKRWDTFYRRGKLSYIVIEDIFKEETPIMYQHKDYILNVMEKFDIIIRPKKSEVDDENLCYYVPCMITAEPDCDIHEMFKVPNCRRSTWLCFKFRFLPPHLMNHVIASLSREYIVSEIVGTTSKKRQIALFKGTAVFDIPKTSKLRKLLVMTYPSAIHIQVWELGEEIKAGVFKYIADFVTDEMNKIIGTRFRMSNVKFEKKWECGLTKSESVTGSNDFSYVCGKDFYCETCTATHKFVDEWSDIPSLPKILEASKELTSDKEGATQTNIIPENPYKSSEAAAGLTSDIQGTTHTNIIQEKEHKSDHKSTIGEKHDYIVQQRLDISNILDRMITHLVISVKDRHCIEHNKSQDEQTKTLLDMVIKRGGTTNNVFIDVLTECGYKELANSLKKESENKSQSSKIGLDDVPDYKIRLQKNYLEIINRLKHSDQ